MDRDVKAPIVAEALAQAIARARPKPLPAPMRATLESMFIDIAGLCVAARNMSYVHAALGSWEANGESTVIGHLRTLDAAGAAFVNGTAAHGEDFDDTFEGGPVHAGVVIVPALLAAAERHRIPGHDMLFGMAVGAEVMCRGAMVAPKRIHKAGFHPTAVLGAMGAAAGIAAALRVDEKTFASAQGIAGSMASGIIEYLAEGTSTKRMHPGWAAQAGMRAVDLARAGFEGPRTVWEGEHGFLHGFAHTMDGDWAALSDGFGERWVSSSIAFKPYACGTMIHPYIDCARALAAEVGKDVSKIAGIQCETAEGIVHRLWEPLGVKQRPPNAYAAKFSVPFCVAYAIVHGAVGLEAFTEENASDGDIAALASKVSYVIDPDSPYPGEFTGHVKVTLAGGRVLEKRQGHFRGGAHAPLTREEIVRKFRANCAYGGWDGARIEAWLELASRAFDSGELDLAPFRG